MMKRLLSSLLLVVMIGVGVNGCSSSSEPSTGDGVSSFFPLAVGNWWKHRSVVLDSSGAEDPKTVSIDSSVVVALKDIEGRQAAVMVSYDLDGVTPTATDTNYYYADANGLWIYADDSLTAFGAGTALEAGWIKVADFQQTKWDVFSAQLADTLDVGQGTVILKEIRISGENKGNHQVTVQGKTYDAVQIELLFEITAELDLGVIKQPLSIQFRQTTWYAQGVGPVKSTSHFQLVSQGQVLQQMQELTELLAYSVTL